MEFDCGDIGCWCSNGSIVDDVIEPYRPVKYFLLSFPWSVDTYYADIKVDFCWSAFWNAE